MAIISGAASVYLNGKHIGSGMVKYNAPPPPRDMNQMWTVSEQALTSCPDITSYWITLAEKVAHEIRQNFVKRVGFYLARDVATRSIMIHASTRILKGDPGIEPRDMQRVKEALLLGIWDFEQLDMRDLVAYLNTQPGSVTTTAIPPANSPYHQWSVNVPLWGAMPMDLPAPPPAPEPMWSPTAVYGFRLFKISVDGVLTGQVSSWEEPTMEAECLPHELSQAAKEQGHAPPEHDAPHWGCHCGIYVVNEPTHRTIAAGERLVPNPGDLEMRRGLVAVGIIRLTGTIVEHREGARGQYGKIVAIWANYEAGTRIRTQGRYIGVPVEMVEQAQVVWDESATSIAYSMANSRELFVPAANQIDYYATKNNVHRHRAQLIKQMEYARQQLIAMEEEKWHKSENLSAS